MIILDTNIISELMRVTPNPMIIDWLDKQLPHYIYTTSICLFEIQYGIEILLNGKRKRLLQQAFENTIFNDLEGRVLEFDIAAAKHSAKISAALRAIGRPVEIRDVQIAGIVAANEAILATRNIRHFSDTGVSLLNPWNKT